MVGAAVNVTLDAGGVCTDARVVLGAVAPTAVVVPDAAAALIGHKLDDATLASLDKAARAACKPIDDKRGTIVYRTKVAGVLARRHYCQISGTVVAPSRVHLSGEAQEECP